MNNDDKKLSGDKDLMVNNNQIDSDENSKLGEDEIRSFDEVFPNHKPQEDVPEISGTDDV
jgi:hypothetical protein